MVGCVACKPVVVGKYTAVSVGNRDVLIRSYCSINIRISRVRNLNFPSSLSCSSSQIQFRERGHQNQPRENLNDVVGQPTTGTPNRAQKQTCSVFFYFVCILPPVFLSDAFSTNEKIQGFACWIMFLTSRQATLTATITTGSSERPFPSCRYALSRNLPLGVGKRHSDTYCVLVVSSAFEGCDTVLSSLLSDLGPLDHGRRDEEGGREDPCAEPQQLMVSEWRKEEEQFACGEEAKSTCNLIYHGRVCSSQPLSE